MKYNHRSLEIAVRSLLPHVEAMRNANIPVPGNPKLLRDIAEEHFVGKTPSVGRKELLLDIARQAIIDLETEGQFVFGDVDISDVSPVRDYRIVGLGVMRGDDICRFTGGRATGYVVDVEEKGDSACLQDALPADLSIFTEGSIGSKVRIK